MRRPTLFLLALGIMLISGLSLIFVSANKKTDGVAADESINNDEDYFADNIELVKYTKEGALYYEMKGARITHNDTSDTAFVTQPTMTLYSAKNVKWHIKANDGKLYNHQQAVDLTNDVVISKFEKAKDTPALLLTTNSVTLHPDSNTFTTGDAVEIQTDSTHTTATGMKANLDSNHIELLNNVRSHYDGK
jgi:lipopolysaccharide export system protein LptC